MSYIIGYWKTKRTVQGIKIKRYYPANEYSTPTESSSIIAEIKIDVPDSEITIYDDLSTAETDLEEIQSMKNLESICPENHKKLKKIIPNLKIFYLYCQEMKRN